MKNLIKLIYQNAIENPKWLIGFVMSSLQTLLVNMLLGLGMREILNQNLNSHDIIFLIIFSGIYLILIIPFVGYLMESQTCKIKCNLMNIVYRQLLAETSSHTSKEVQLLQKDVKTVAEMFSWRFAVLWQAVLSGVVALIIIFVYSWQLAVISIILGVVILVIHHLLSVRYEKIVNAIRDDWRSVIKKFMSMLDHLRIIRVYGLENTQIEELKEINNTYFSDKEKELNTKNNLKLFEQIICDLVFYTGFIIFGSMLIVYRLLTFPNLVYLLQLSVGISFLFTSIGFYLVDSKTGIISLNNLLVYLYSDTKVEENQCPIVVACNEIEINDLNLHFEDRVIFDNFNLKIDSTRLVKIKGSNGSGKSTLFKIIMKELVPDGGEVLIGGINVNCLSQKQLLSIVGYVPQIVPILPVSIIENIYLDKVVDKQELEYFLELTELREDFEDLNKQLTKGGINISAGQAQRLGLVRSLVHHPKIIILDEFDANIDKQMYQRIIARLESNYQLIIVEHNNYILKENNYLIDL